MERNGKAGILLNLFLRPGEFEKPIRLEKKRDQPLPKRKRVISLSQTKKYSNFK